MKSLILILISLASAGSAQASSAGQILNGYAAKDFCSCFFVVGLTEKQCKSRVGVGFPLPHGNIRVDREKGIVTVGRLFKKNVRVSIWTKTRLGCRLLPPAAEVANNPQDEDSEDSRE